MRIFVAGATGALGQRLVPKLVDRGHEVTGMTRTEAKCDLVRELGASPGRRRRARPRGRRRAVARGRAGGHRPRADLARRRDRPAQVRRSRSRSPTGCAPRAPTTCSRPAARPGARRFVAQSFAGWPYARVGGPVKSEDDPLDPTRPTRCGRPRSRRSATSRRRSPAPTGPRASCCATAASTGPALARLEPDGEHDGDGPQAHVPGRRQRRRHLVAHPHRRRRDGDRRRDRARARPASTTSSTTSRPRSPSGSRRWRRRSAPSRRATCRAGSARLARRRGGGGDDDRDARGASNEKAKRELGWQPAYASWRQGFADGARLTRCRPRRDDRGASPTGVRDRLPDAGQRRRGRGRRPGGAAAPPRRASRPASGSPRRGPGSSTVVTRLAIDELRSARVRRERYVGEWLPEPLLTDEARATPRAEAETADSLSLAFLVLLESLTPEQRAVFLLHDVFDYALRARSPRSSASRPTTSASSPSAPGVRSTSGGRASRPRASSATPSPTASSPPSRRATSRGLESLLADDVVLHGDGGGKVPALARPLSGRVRVARTLRAWVKAGERMRRVHPAPGRAQRPARRDHASTPTAGSSAPWRSRSTAMQILAVHSIVNPEKLGHLGELADLDALRRR